MEWLKTCHNPPYFVIIRAKNETKKMSLTPIIISNIGVCIIFILAAIALYSVIAEKMFSVPLAIFLIITALYLGASTISLNSSIVEAEEEFNEHTHKDFSVGLYEFVYHVHPEITGDDDFDVHIGCFTDVGKECQSTVDCTSHIHYPNNTLLDGDQTMTRDDNGHYNHTIPYSKIQGIEGYYEYWIYCNATTQDKGGAMVAHFEVIGNQTWDAKMDTHIISQYKLSIIVTRVITALFIVLTLYLGLKLLASNIKGNKRKEREGRSLSGER